MRLDGRFASVRARSVPVQRPPYRPLGRVVADQHVFELADVEGSMVGFRFPAYVEGIEVAGYHLHFISADRRRGGHVLGSRSGGELRARIDPSADLHVELPPAVNLADPDLAADTHAAIDAAEHAGLGERSRGRCRDPADLGGEPWQAVAASETPGPVVFSGPGATSAADRRRRRTPVDLACRRLGSGIRRQAPGRRGRNRGQKPSPTRCTAAPRSPRVTAHSAVSSRADPDPRSALAERVDSGELDDSLTDSAAPAATLAVPADHGHLVGGHSLRGLARRDAASRSASPARASPLARRQRL